MKSNVLAGVTFCGTPVNIKALRKLTGCRPVKFPHPHPSSNAVLSIQPFPAFSITLLILQPDSHWRERFVGYECQKMEAPFRNPFLKPGFKI